MGLCVLTISAREVSGRVLGLAGPEPTGEGLAEAVRRYLGRHQPWLAERVVVGADGPLAVVLPKAPRGGRPGEGALELLRAVEGVLGMADKLPEVPPEAELPELEVDGDLLGHVESVNPAAVAGEDPVLLRSKVRHFPLPVAEWFEIREGWLTLTPRRIRFEPRPRPALAEGGAASGEHAVALGRVRGVRRDTWCHVPCLRVETDGGPYRYGWPPRREEPGSSFDVTEWLETLRTLLERMRGTR